MQIFLTLLELCIITIFFILSEYNIITQQDAIGYSIITGLIYLFIIGYLIDIDKGDE